MKKHFAVFAFAVIFQTGIASAQEENNSRWSVSGGLIPHFTGDYWSGIVGIQNGLGINYYYPSLNTLPAADFKIDYEVLKNFSLEAGVGYLLYNTSIVKWDIYSMNVEGGWNLDYDIENANIHILELPCSLNYYALNKKHYRAYASIGDVSSFAVAKTYPDAYDYKIQVGQTTIYQNYLQFALGFEMKASQKWSYYFSPMYRMALVNYHDVAHYDIYAYPNVFYERMLGLELGAKYHILAKSAN